MPTPRVSFVIPCYREAENVDQLFERICAVMESEDHDFDVLFVDDGSPDDTRDRLRRLRAGDSRACWLGLSRNFGHQVALSAGLDTARGDWLITMDADLEHPPEVVPEMLEAAREGADVVLTVRRYTEQHGFFKKATAWLFYALMKRVSRVEVEAGAADFRLLTRKAAHALSSMRERHRFLRGMVAWMGFRVAHVPYTAEHRQRGRSSYSVRRMLRFAVDGILSFSGVPLRLAALAGIVLVVLAGAYGIHVAYVALVSEEAVPGWASLIATMLLLGGVQLLVLGVIGEYIARVYEEVKRRPLYFVDECDGIPPPPTWVSRVDPASADEAS